MTVFFKWCLVGKEGITSEKKVQMKLIKLIAFYGCLSDYQVSRSKLKVSKHMREFLLQVFTGLPIYQLTCSSNLVNFIHSLGLSVNYSHIWEIINRIAKSVVVKMNANERLLATGHNTR